MYQTLVEEEHNLFEASSESELLDGMSQRLVKTGLFDLVGLAWPDEERIVRCRFVSGGHGRELIDKWSSSLDEDQPGTIVREVLRSGKVFLSSDHLHDVRDCDCRVFARELGIKAWAAFPIKRSSVPWGVISVAAGDCDFFDHGTVALLTSSAQLLGRALDAFDLRARIKRLNSLYSLQMTQSEIISGADNEETLVQETCRKLADGRLFDTVFIVPAGIDGSKPLAIAAAGQSDEPDSHTFSATTNLINLILQRCPIGRCSVNDLARCGSGAVASQAFERMEWKSAAMEPITRGHRLFAHLGVVSRCKDLFDTEVLSLVARMAESLHRALDQIDVKRELDRELAQQAWLALHDPLTSLYNRTGLDLHIDKAFARVKRTGGMINAIMLDIDDFKHINDTFGHAAGDEILSQVAQRIIATVRQSDFVARLGGDEFIMIAEDMRTAVDSVALLGRLSNLWQKPFRLSSGTEICVAGSFGLAKYTGSADTPDALCHRADAALYLTKKNKKNRKACWQIHDDADIDIVV